jgi:hypothetical protein
VLVIGLIAVLLKARGPIRAAADQIGTPERQMPDTHTGVLAGQTLPQPPQLFGSLWVSMHAPLQRLLPDGHVQTPDWQVWAPVHAWPQVPQLFASLCRLAHVPEQF